MQYNVDVKQSEIMWEARKRIGKVEHGTVQFAAGSLQVEDGQLTGGEFTVDLQTINAVDDKGDSIEMLNKHLKSVDFFGVEQYSQARLKFADVQGGQVRGEMTIRDKTNPVVFPVKLEITENQVVLQTEFSFDRSLFEIKYGSDKFFKSLGDELIENEVKLRVKVVAAA